MTCIGNEMLDFVRARCDCLIEMWSVSDQLSWRSGGRVGAARNALLRSSSSLSSRIGRTWHRYVRWSDTRRSLLLSSLRRAIGHVRMDANGCRAYRGFVHGVTAGLQHQRDFVARCIMVNLECSLLNHPGMSPTALGPLTHTVFSRSVFQLA